jgi:hypothetical protein
MCNHEDTLLAEKMREVLALVDEHFETGTLDEQVEFLKETVVFQAMFLSQMEANSCGNYCGCEEKDDDEDEDCCCMGNCKE